VTSEGAARTERSPADVLRLVVAAALLLAFVLVAALFGDTLVGFASDLLRGLDALPAWLVDLVLIGTRVLAVAVLGGLLVQALVRHRWRMLVTVVAAGVAGGLLAWLLATLLSTDEGRVPVASSVGFGPLTSEGSPTMAGIAAITAVLTAAAPWLGRWPRRAGWALVLGLALTSFLSAPVSFRAVFGVLVGWLAGAAVLVALGAPSRRPTREAIIEGLAAVGLPVATLDRAGVDARGSTPYFGVAEDGSRLFVKALGEDERSADLLFRLYRRLRPHDFGDERPFTTLRRAVEHEAFVALTARSLAVPTPAVRAFATAEPNGYVLAYEAIAGRSLDRLEPAEVTDEVLAEIWSLVAILREHRIAHRDLRLANIFLDDRGVACLIDFGFSEVAASDVLLATDVAELIASSSAYVGAERAVAPAAASVDPATLRRAVARLRPWALSGATRTALAARKELLEELRRRTAAAAAAPAPAVAGR
jgi:glycosyltransferase 2 family protein